MNEINEKNKYVQTLKEITLWLKGFEEGRGDNFFLSRNIKDLEEMYQYFISGSNDKINYKKYSYSLSNIMCWISGYNTRNEITFLNDIMKVLIDIKTYFRRMENLNDTNF